MELSQFHVTAAGLYQVQIIILKRPWSDIWCPCFHYFCSLTHTRTHTPQLTTHLSPHKCNRNSTVFVGAWLLLNKPVHACLLDRLCVFLYSAAMQSSARGNQLQSVTLSCCVREESLHLSVLMNEDSAVWFWCKKPSSQAVDCGQLPPFHQRWKCTHTCCLSLLMRNEMSKMDHKWADFTGCCTQVCSHSVDVYSHPFWMCMLLYVYAIHLNVSLLLKIKLNVYKWMIFGYTEMMCYTGTKQLVNLLYLIHFSHKQQVPYQCFYRDYLTFYRDCRNAYVS